MSEYSPLGKHVLIDCYQCQLDISDPTNVNTLLRRSALKSGATIVSEHFHAFSPVGVSGVIIIEESHFTIHTWPEHGFASIDAYTCGDTIDFKKAINCLKEALKPTKIVVKEFERGNHLIKEKI